MKEFKDVIKYILTQAMLEGEPLEIFDDHIYSHALAIKEYPAILLISEKEPVIAARNNAYTLVEGKIQVFIIPSRAEETDYQTAADFADEYGSIVRQVLLDAGRLVTPSYPNGFLAEGHHQISAGDIDYGDWLWDAVNTTPSAMFTISAKYQATI